MLFVAYGSVNRAQQLCGYTGDPKAMAPRGKYKPQFGRNELKLTIINMRDQHAQGKLITFLGNGTTLGLC